MIQHVWSVLCQNASFDVQTNNVSLFNIIENVVTIGEPALDSPAVLSCELISLWAREEGSKPCSGQMRAKIIIPKAEEPHIIILDIDLSHAQFHRTRLTIGALPLFTSGRFEFQIDYRLIGNEAWTHATRLPFWVVKQKSENSLSAN